MASSSKSIAKNCSFEENPYIISWVKSNFKLDVHMDYQSKTSFVVFEFK